MRSLLPFHTMPVRAALYAAYSVMIFACCIIVSWMMPRHMKVISGSTKADSTAA
jgi:hypothetical protein